MIKKRNLIFDHNCTTVDDDIIVLFVCLCVCSLLRISLKCIAFWCDAHLHKMVGNVVIALILTELILLLKIWCVVVVLLYFFFFVYFAQRFCCRVIQRGGQLWIYIFFFLHLKMSIKEQRKKCTSQKNRPQ